MNWVETEIAAVAKAGPDPDAWLTCYPSSTQRAIRDTGECDHRWFKREDQHRPVHLRGWYRLAVRTFCRKCKAEA